MTIQQMKYVLTIVRTGSFNKASEILYISQPALTNSVKDLESELGVRLFVRNGKGALLTPEGEEFCGYARQLCQQYEYITERYSGTENKKTRFSVSAQHYSFVSAALVRLIAEKKFARYDITLRETRTKVVIADVRNQYSDIGILYLSDFNRSAITKLLRNNGLEFHRLLACPVCVFLHKSHPLADRAQISFAELKPYPCLVFDQGEDSSFYYAEEVLTTAEYDRVIHVSDSSSMKTMLAAMDGYVLCSGLCEDKKQGEFLTIPYLADETNPGGVMEIGYITKNGMVLGELSRAFLALVREELHLPPEDPDAQV